MWAWRVKAVQTGNAARPSLSNASRVGEEGTQREGCRKAYSRRPEMARVSKMKLRGPRELGVGPFCVLRAGSNRLGSAGVAPEGGGRSEHQQNSCDSRDSFV